MEVSKDSGKYGVMKESGWRKRMRWNVQGNW